MGSRSFPIKAPTRQMLYPLSYRGIAFNGRGMLTPVVDLVNHGHSSKNHEKEIAREGDLFSKNVQKDSAITPRESVPGSLQTRVDRSAHRQ